MNQTALNQTTPNQTTPNQTTLRLPCRAEKPRDTGLTMVIDGGVPLWYFTDLVSSAEEYIDFVKFGWGTQGFAKVVGGV